MRGEAYCDTIISPSSGKWERRKERRKKGQRRSLGKGFDAAQEERD